MEFLDAIKDRIPDYAKDIRLNLDAVVARSSLPPEDALGVALAAAFASKSAPLIEAFQRQHAGRRGECALTAAALMGMNNVWYPYVEMAADEELKTVRPELRMNAYASSGGVEKKKFEAYALAASIVGKCHFCVQSPLRAAEEGGLHGPAAARHRPHRGGGQRGGPGAHRGLIPARPRAGALRRGRAGRRCYPCAPATPPPSCCCCFPLPSAWTTDTPVPDITPTRPTFAARAAELIGLLREHDAGGIARLMNLSPALAELNVARYAAWRPRATAANSKPALFAFAGDVYEGLEAASLGLADIAWAQEHVAILSGLYGVLRPLDRLQPYRLEMGTRFANPPRPRPLCLLGPHDRRASRRTSRRPGAPRGAQPRLRGVLQVRRPRRTEGAGGAVRVRGGARRGLAHRRLPRQAGRGLMARYAIRRRARSPKALEGFDLEGYALDRGRERARPPRVPPRPSLTARFLVLPA
jgi:AhpD family alkylhydroperoxidase